VLVHALPLFHVHGLVVALHGALFAGAACALVERFDAQAVVDEIARRRATLFMGVPTMYHRLAALPPGGWPNWVLGNHDRPRVASRVGRDQLRVAAMLLLTLRGTPTIYYGEEVGRPVRTRSALAMVASTLPSASSSCAKSCAWMPCMVKAATAPL